jgi:uncharacterized protein YndB with AHSA1/START domain
MVPATGDKKAVLTLPNETQILVTRAFDAPCHLVYRAWTTPELVRRWWHAKRGEMTVAEIDLRVGGRWRYAMMMPSGDEVAFHGEYREIVPDERLVSTEVFEGAPDHEALTTATFSGEGERTLVTLLVDHWSREVRDMVLKTGMEDGLQDALELLEEAARTARAIT